MPDKFAYFSMWLFISSFILSFIFSVFGSDVVLIESSLYVGQQEIMVGIYGAK